MKTLFLIIGLVSTLALAGITITPPTGGAGGMNTNFSNADPSANNINLNGNSLINVLAVNNAAGGVEVNAGSGNVSLATSADIVMAGGNSNEGTVSDVWTSTSVGGAGAWAAPTSGGDLWSDVVDANILSDANGTRTVGGVGSAFLEIHTADIFNAGGQQMFDLVAGEILALFDISPESVGARNLGTSSRPWDIGFVQSVNIRNVGDGADTSFLLAVNPGTGVILNMVGKPTLPGGGTAEVGIRSDTVALGLAIYTINNGAGDSGPIFIDTGTATGTRAAVTINSNLLAVNSGIRPTLLTADPCADTTAFPEATIFYNTTDDIYCFCDGAGDDVKMSSPNMSCF